WDRVHRPLACGRWSRPRVAADTMTEVFRAAQRRRPRLPHRRKGVHCPVASVIDTVVNLAKRRGFVYPAGEIYGGTKSAWDYGPLGVELKKNIKRQGWRAVGVRPDRNVGRGLSVHPPPPGWGG